MSSAALAHCAACKPHALRHQSANPSFRPAPPAAQEAPVLSALSSTWGLGWFYALSPVVRHNEASAAQREEHRQGHALAEQLVSSGVGRGARAAARVQRRQAAQAQPQGAGQRVSARLDADRVGCGIQPVRARVARGGARIPASPAHGVRARAVGALNTVCVYGMHAHGAHDGCTTTLTTPPLREAVFCPPPCTARPCHRHTPTPRHCRPTPSWQPPTRWTRHCTASGSSCPAWTAPCGRPLRPRRRRRTTATPMRRSHAARCSCRWACSCPTRSRRRGSAGTSPSRPRAEQELRGATTSAAPARGVGVGLSHRV